MLRKQVLCMAVMAAAMISCSASMLRRPQPEAGQSTGIVRFLFEGADFLIEQRREDAEEQMAAVCHGSYEIVDERIRAAGASSTYYEGNDYMAPAIYSDVTEYWYIEFRCKPEQPRHWVPE